MDICDKNEKKKKTLNMIIKSLPGENKIYTWIQNTSVNSSNMLGHVLLP